MTAPKLTTVQLERLTSISKERRSMTDALTASLYREFSPPLIQRGPDGWQWILTDAGRAALRGDK